MQGNESVWSSTLPSGEHLLEGIAPGNYVLKVDHTCLETYEFVSLLDDAAPGLNAVYNGFVPVESNGGAWLEAACTVCETGDGFGYTWFLDGEEVGSDAPLAVRVEQVGTYALELVSHGFACTESESFEITVGKYLQDQSVGLEWLGIHAGQFGIRFPHEWKGAEFGWWDAAGRLVENGTISVAAGEVFVSVPPVHGWTVFKVQSSDGLSQRWVGVVD